MTTHNILIVVHALGGVVSLITGIILIIPSLHHNTRSHLLKVFLPALMVLVIGLFAVVIFDWQGFSLAQKIPFGVLCLLALYMSWRAFQAYRVFQGQSEGWMALFVDHIGFNLISLFDGFVIVSSLDLGAPGWLVGLIAVVGVIAGIWAINRVKAVGIKGTA